MLGDHHRSNLARVLHVAQVGLFTLFLMGAVANLAFGPVVAWSIVAKLLVLGLLGSLTKIVVDPAEDVVWPGTTEAVDGD